MPAISPTRAVTAATVTPSESTPRGNLDAKLVRLGRQFEPLAIESDRLLLIANEMDFAAAGPSDAAAEQRAIDAEIVYKAARQRADDVVTKIMRLPARTLDGLIVKARVAAWCYGGDSAASGNPNKVDDVSVSSAIVHDLLMLDQNARPLPIEVRKRIYARPLPAAAAL